jgi:hypothetical protein
LAGLASTLVPSCTFWCRITAEFEATGPASAAQQVKKKKRSAAMQLNGFIVLQIVMKKLS